jgi:hypothetical protein
MQDINEPQPAPKTAAGQDDDEDLPAPPPPKKAAATYKPAPNAHEWPEREEVERWTPVQVAEWATLMGFEKYAHSFVTHKITGKLLVQLEEHQLSHMGIGVLGVRLKLIDNITQLKRIYWSAKQPCYQQKSFDKEPYYKPKELRRARGASQAHRQHHPAQAHLLVCETALLPAKEL